MEIAFGILGQTTMRMHDRLSADWGTLKLHQMLAALLVRPGQRVGIHTLTDWVWSTDDQEPNDPAATFRTYAGRINRALRDVGAPATLHAIDGALCLNADREVIDYFVFRDLVKEGREHSKHQDHDTACTVLTEAVNLWRDQPLADLPSQPAQDWRHWAIHHVWLPANQLLLGELITLGRFDTALVKLDELQREHRADLGLAQRRLDVQYALDQKHDMAAYHVVVRKLLQADGDDAAAAALLKYYNAMTEEHKTTGPNTSAGARNAAERLAAVPFPRPPVDRDGTDLPRTLLPTLPSRGRSLLPQMETEFIGHDDLQTTLDELARTTDGRFRPGVIVLDGLAGIGKTALALHWARRQYGKLVDNALYVDLHGFDGGRRNEPEDVIDELLGALDIPMARFAGRTRREAKLRDVLAGTRTLVVLDNASDSAHVRPLLFTLSPCLLLVTSRKSLTALVSRHGARHCSVTSLNTDDAAKVLTSRIGPKAVSELEPVARLTALCSGIPLALQLVAHHIEGRHGSVLTQVANELQDQSRILDIGDDGDDPPASMRAALAVTYQALPSEAQTLLQFIGLSPTPELTLHAAASLLGQPVRSARRALNVLVSTHFLTRGDESDSYRIHDLLRTFARELAECEIHVIDRTAAERRLLSYYLQTSFNADRILFPFRPPVPMLPNAESTPVLDFLSEQDAKIWLISEKSNFAAIIPWSAKNKHYEFTWRMPHNFYGLYRRLGYYGELRDAYEIAVSSTQAIRDTESEGASRSDLGLIHVALGDWASAVQEFHLAAAIARRNQSAIGTATSLLHLGSHQAHLGNWNEATILYQQALERAADIDSAGTQSAILHRLAETYRIRGQLQESLDLYQQALAFRVSIGNHHGQADTLTEIAATLCERRDYAAATMHGLRALVIIEQINDTEVGPRACFVMATISYELERFDSCIEYARQAVRLAIHNHNAPVEAGALHILGHALRELGRFDAAEEGWQHSAAVYLDLGDHGRRRHLEGDLASLTTTRNHLPAKT